MLDRNNLPQEYVDQVKRYLNITWSDEDTDAKVIDMMLDAEIALNHKIGAEVDYFSPGSDHSLYMSYLRYAYGECPEQFDSAYRAELLQIRHKHIVEASLEAKNET